jgi:hypothetical protein
MQGVSQWYSINNDKNYRKEIYFWHSSLTSALFSGIPSTLLDISSVLDIMFVEVAKEIRVSGVDT